MHRQSADVAPLRAKLKLSREIELRCSRRMRGGFELMKAAPGGVSTKILTIRDRPVAYWPPGFFAFLDAFQLRL
jgi:hypothetical protein